LARHLKSCKGVPSLTCKVCKKVFKHQSSHSRHQISCKRKQESDTHIPETNGSTIINNNTTINNTVNNIINIRFGNENIRDLLTQTKYDERLLVIADKLKATQEIQTDIKQKEKRYKNLKAMREKGTDVETLKNEILSLKEKHTGDMFSVLMDLVYFNADIPQNHTIRKMIKKSDIIEIRDNDLWNPISTNSVIQTILRPICKLAQGLADVPENMFTADDYSKQNFNDIMYWKTQRGNLNAERILQPYESPPMETSSSSWQELQGYALRTYSPCWAGHRRSYLEKDMILQDLKDTAEGYGIKHFSCYREGEVMFDEIIQRFPE